MEKDYYINKNFCFCDPGELIKARYVNENNHYKLGN